MSEIVKDDAGNASVRNPGNESGADSGSGRRSHLKRKLKKLKREPMRFLIDSRAYTTAQKGIYLTWAKFGSFALVILSSLLLIFYYGFIASPRYVSEVQFVVKQSGGGEIPFSGIASIGAISGSMRDALIIKEFIESRDMAEALDNEIQLKKHFQQSGVDYLSRLRKDASVEEFVKFYRNHIKVLHDTLSDIVYVEVQAFDREYALLFAEKLLEISETFINNFGSKLASEQMRYAQAEVERVHGILKTQQVRLSEFQEENRLYSPEQEGGALQQAIIGLQSELIKADARLKELRAIMRDDAPEVRSQKNLINSLTLQLEEERMRLTSSGENSINNVNIKYQEIKLSAELASDLYKSALASLEVVRSEAYRKLKHLLIVQHPALAEKDKYPRRLYSILTWFAGLLLIYFVGRLVMAIVKEHKD